MISIFNLVKAMNRQFIPGKAFKTLPMISEYPLLVNHNTKKVVGKCKIYLEKGQWMVKVTHDKELPSKRFSLGGSVERDKDQKISSFCLFEIALTVKA